MQILLLTDVFNPIRNYKFLFDIMSIIIWAYDQALCTYHDEMTPEWQKAEENFSSKKRFNNKSLGNYNF